MNTYQTVSVVMPVYNEEKTIETIIKRVAQADVLGLNKEIICVNDGSKDGSEKVLCRLQEVYSIRVFHQKKNMGKGAALHRGFQEATGYIVCKVSDCSVVENAQGRS